MSSPSPSPTNGGPAFFPEVKDDASLVDASSPVVTGKLGDRSVSPKPSRSPSPVESDDDDFMQRFVKSTLKQKGALKPTTSVAVHSARHLAGASGGHAIVSAVGRAALTRVRISAEKAPSEYHTFEYYDKARADVYSRAERVNARSKSTVKTEGIKAVLQDSRTSRVYQKPQHTLARQAAIRAHVRELEDMGDPSRPVTLADGVTQYGFHASNGGKYYPSRGPDFAGLTGADFKRHLTNFMSERNQETSFERYLRSQGAI